MQYLIAHSVQVPALVKFNGHPEVSQSGELLYVFPSLQRTAKAQVSCTCTQIPLFEAMHASVSLWILKLLIMHAEEGGPSSKGCCSGAQMEFHQCFRGAEAGRDRTGRGKLRGRAVSGQPVGVARCQPDACSELPRLHEQPVPLSTGIVPPSEQNTALSMSQPRTEPFVHSTQNLGSLSLR